MRIAILSLALVSLLPAQPKPGANPLFSAKELKCTFTIYAAGRWVADGPQVISNPQEFSFQVELVDLKKKRARIVGSSGSAAEAALFLTSTGVNTLEQTPSGNFNLTTVFAGAGTNNKYLAAHSRHLGDSAAPPAVSQNYGSCEIVK
jgi:hypothetical protein